MRKRCGALAVTGALVQWCCSLIGVRVKTGGTRGQSSGKRPGVKVEVD